MVALLVKKSSEFYVDHSYVAIFTSLRQRISALQIFVSLILNIYYYNAPGFRSGRISFFSNQNFAGSIFILFRTFSICITCPANFRELQTVELLIVLFLLFWRSFPLLGQNPMTQK
jgi:hypothetical protein